MPFIILLVEWIYWLGSSREFNSPKEFWAIFSNLMFGSIGALMQAGPADLTPASCRKIEAMPTYFIILAFGFFTLIICSSYTANLAAFLTTAQVQVCVTKLAEALRLDSKARSRPHTPCFT